MIALRSSGSLPGGVRKPLNVSDYRLAARRRLPRGLFDFLDRGSEDDRAVAANRAGFAQLRLRPRILRGAAGRSLKVTLFGVERNLPICLAPIGIAGHLWYRGEAALAHAAARAGIPFILSGVTNLPLEDVAGCGDGDKWFQLYVSGDRERTMALVPRIAAAGYSTLVLTADSLVSYKREFATRSGFDIPFRLRLSGVFDMATHPHWLFGTIGRYLRAGGLPKPAEYPMAPPGDPAREGVALKDDGLDWAFVKQLRAAWPGTLAVKGLLDARDARLCVEHGVDAIIVSNHGGIALDAAVTPIEVLSGIAEAVGVRAAILMDGGVLRGSDVVKACALGADMVSIGRAAMYGLAAAGERGVVDVLSLLAAEIDRTLAQLGCRSIADLTPDHVIGNRSLGEVPA